MKFGKSIRAESRSNRGLAFINFKFLKRIIKRSAVAARAGYAEIAVSEDEAFLAALDVELAKVATAYWSELREIALLQESIAAAAPSLESLPDSDLYRNMTFDQLQAHLEGLGGLREAHSASETRSSSGGSVSTNGDSSEEPVCSSPSEASTAASPCLIDESNSVVSASARASVALCEFCVTLGQLSARCKRLRGCVLWNVVAVVKILKKRQKQHGSGSRLSGVTAMDVLARQAWYREPHLPQIVSTVETTIGNLMSRLSHRLPCMDEYRCPICLEVVLDPVCLRTCGHRFCWACLCQAYLDKPDGTLERCPTCRSAFALDPLAFQVDGILSRFLRNYFPEDICHREQEQKENLRQRLWQQCNQLEQVPSVCCPDCPVINRTLVERAADWLGDSELCAHALRVRSGRPADVTHFVMKSCKSSLARTQWTSTTAAPAADMDSATMTESIDKLLEDYESDRCTQEPRLRIATVNKNTESKIARDQWLTSATAAAALTTNVTSAVRWTPALAPGGPQPPSRAAAHLLSDGGQLPRGLVEACRTMRLSNALDEEDDLDFARCGLGP